MSSWNIPALADKISEDIPGLKNLLNALFKKTDSGTTDALADAKRIHSITGGVQIQKYSNSNWADAGKLMHDADTLDGKHAATGQAADTIPVRDSNGAVTGSITGNAATATEASSLASGYVVPIANGGTNANTAAGARANFGADNASNFSSGVFSTSVGGTGRTDGKALDVYLSEYSAGAMSLGQLGSASQKSAVDADTLTAPGLYFCSSCTAALKYPEAGECFLRVASSGEVQKEVNGVTQSFFYYVQRVTIPSTGKEYERKSVDSGSTWSAWTSSDATETSDVHIYVSKGGSDFNSGFDSSSPILTVGRFGLIAAGVKTTGRLICHFSPGEWGNLSLDSGLLLAKSVRVTNYPDTQTTITPIVAEGETVPEGTYFEDLDGTLSNGNQPPHFDSIAAHGIALGFGNISVDSVSFSNVLYISSAAISFCSLSALNSHIELGSHIVREKTGVTSPVFALDNSYLGISCGFGLCNLEANLSNAVFLQCQNTCSLQIDNTVNWNGSFAGQKFSFSTPVTLYGTMTPDVLPGISGNGSWFNKKFVRVKNESNAFCNLSVKKESTLATAYIEARNNDAALVNDVAETAILGIVHESDGTKYGIAPTPPNGDKSNKIATTEWVSGNSFPAGTRMTFQQSAAPSGWTKETGSGYNNIAMRLTTGTIANKTDGKAFTDCMASGRTTTSATQGGTLTAKTVGGTVGNKALSVAMLAGHTHAFNKWGGDGSQRSFSQVAKSNGNGTTSSAGSSSNHNHSFTGSSHNHTFTGSGHTHTLDLDINYIDFIVATKA